MVGHASGFAAFALSPAIRAALDGMGITVPTPIQSEAIPHLLRGRDVLGQARTGSGKTLAFGVPMVERADASARTPQALVLVPTRELAIQVGDVLGRLAAARGLRLALLYGGRPLGAERVALARGPHLLVGTPGRTLDHLRQGSLSLGALRLLVLDEGDEMLDRGFAPDVERILSTAPAGRQTAIFSATMPEWLMGTVTRHLREPMVVRVDREGPAPEIEHVVFEMESGAKMAALRTLLDSRGDNPMIVFGRTKHGVKKLARQLVQLGYPAAALQGNLSQNARERVMADFRAGRVPVLLATNVAARGLDVANVEQVINYELPESAEWFTHRSGRTGRMGRRGEAITFLTPEDAAKWRQIERALGRKLPRKAWPTAASTGSAPRLAAPPAVAPSRPGTVHQVADRANGSARRSRAARRGRALRGQVARA
jgi:ATP-dependent RNA helicase DeaD